MAVDITEGIDADLSPEGYPAVSPRRRLRAASRRLFRLRGERGYTPDQVIIGIAILSLVVIMGTIAALLILTGAQEDTAAIEFEQTVGAAQQLLGESSLRGSEYYEAVQAFVDACGGFESDPASADNGICQSTAAPSPEGTLTEAVAALLNDAFEGGREIGAAPTAARELGPNEVAVDVQEVDYTALEQYAVDAGTATGDPWVNFDRDVARGINDRGPGDAIRLFMQATDDMHLCAIISQRKGGQTVNGVWYAAYQGIASYDVIRPAAAKPAAGAAEQRMCEWGAIRDDLGSPGLTETLFNESGWYRDAVSAMSNPIGPDVGNRGNITSAAGACTNGTGDSGTENRGSTAAGQATAEACGAWIPYN